MRKIFIIFTLVALFVPCFALAEPDLEAYKQRMEQAAAKSKAGELTSALVDYLEIRVSYAGPEVDYSLGRMYQRLYQCTQAQHYYTQLMMAYDLANNHPIYQRAIEGYDQIAACQSWGTVQVTCTGADDASWIEIDGEKLGQCWGRPYHLPAGEHVFALKSASGKQVEKKLSVADQTKETLTLELPKDVAVKTKEIKVTEEYILKERFAPELYWGLIVGGTAVMGVGGVFAALAYKDMVDVQKFEDRQNKERAQKARDGVKLNKILTYSALGVGGALAASGITLAIISALSDKERVAVNNTTAYIAPSPDGVMLGFGMQF